MLVRKASGFGSLFTGEFYLSAKHSLAAAVPIIVAWLHERYGRTVKIKVGDVEVEGRTAAEVKVLLDHAQAFKRENEPKKII